MAAVSKFSATLRISGDDLDPEEVSRVLGAVPSMARTKGQQYHTPSGRPMIARTGWHLRAAEREPENLDGQVQEILDQLNQDRDVWAQLQQRFKINLFCGLFMRGGNEGTALPAKTLVALGERGIELQLDIYDSTLG